MNSSALKLLTTLYGPSDILLFRPVETWTEGGRKRSCVDFGNVCYRPAKTGTLENTLERLRASSEAERTNLFFGVCPRFGKKGRFDLAWQIRTVRCLWADVDGCTVEEVIERCKSQSLPDPTAVVNSGNGVHLYWLLDRPLLIDDVGDPPPVETLWLRGPNGRKEPKRYIVNGDDRIAIDQHHHITNLSPKALQAQDLLAGIAQAVGGDHTTDLTRLLRLPGTLNRKDQRSGHEPVMASLVECNADNKYPIELFKRFEIPSAAMEPQRQIDAAANRDRIPAMPNTRGGQIAKPEDCNDPPDEATLARMRACYRAIKAMKISDKGDGSHRLYSACCRCVEFDLSDAAALSVIAKYAKHQPFPTFWDPSSVLKRLRSAERKVKRGAAVKDVSRVRPSMLSVGQLLHDHPELRSPVISGLLRNGETMNVIAPPKYGKSWLVTDLAMAVTTGRRWLDSFETVAGNVLILDNELHSETSANRIPKVALARGIGLEEIADKLFVDNLRGRLLDIYSLHSYFKAIPKDFFKVIIMDAFYRFLPKDSDENSNANMTDIYNCLDWYAAMLGCCFVLVHHASKGNQSGKSVTDVGAGAGSQARATDTHLILRQHEEDNCVVVDAAVRSWQPLDSICLRWSFPVWAIDASLDPADLRPERPRKKPKPKEEPQAVAPKWTVDSFVKSFVSDEPATMKSIIASAADTGITQRMARDLIQLAEDAGLIHRWSIAVNRPVKFATRPQPQGTFSEC